MRALPATAVALALAGCGSTGSASQPPRVIPTRLPIARVAKALAAPDAGVRILTPVESQRVGSRFVVHVSVSHFILEDPRASRNALEGHGLLEFSLDGGRFDEPRYSGANGKIALDLAVNGYYSPAYAPEITYREIPPGRHTLSVRLANRDGSPTGVHASVAFEVA